MLQSSVSIEMTDKMQAHVLDGEYESTGLLKGLRWGGYALAPAGGTLDGIAAYNKALEDGSSPTIARRAGVATGAGHTASYAAAGIAAESSASFLSMALAGGEAGAAGGSVLPGLGTVGGAVGGAVVGLTVAAVLNWGVNEGVHHTILNNG